ncbi:MAG: SDR family oxidoreductase [Wenzhouxiangellaceae bacterium]|nr:SDR family oxidoreductase [Wenzhouxiangellaceae bacterium]
MSNVVITGAGRGIGLALSRQFAERGDTVHATCREASTGLEALDVNVIAGVDVTDAKSLAQLAARLDGIGIDILVNNAGVMKPTEFDKFDQQLDAFRIQLEVNSIAPLRVTRALVNRMQRGSKVFIVSSRMGSIGDNDSGGHYGYRMSKAAANMAGVCLAHELKDHGIAVGLLHPGYVRTDMTGNTGNVDPAESAAGLIRRIDELSLETTGSFRHANGEELTW